ncbi:MAG: undecaprenyl/decaprenyl-phosphate alpha-N-acetylglucosaminyl 1-phosphate transferase, partial [Deltaproteobacteria bacterium]|nr:undecaprenyl/decaprenyl-phosphate alpha-N-acetylglucosaminyl 1-phosphate transferase [Deltaproteobacteria bacterium]
GGLAIVSAFMLTLIACALLKTQVSEPLFWDRQRAFAIMGGAIAFGVGFYDDFKRLEPWIKLIAQILAASLAFYGGVRIEAVAAGEMSIRLGILSWFVTVFWFLLLINAVNLIDGLDGLAAGVAFFASMVMVVMAIMQANFLAALEFAALAGALLGFLRYNFNPASIFMGDGGSYFIGYTIAALSILGSIKSQVGATFLIPLLALGVPIFDTILSPLRRWIRGRKMFRPDKGHIHHHLLSMGLTSRRAVLVIYGISCSLCLLSILLINLRNEMAGLLLVALAAAAFVVVRKMGYLEYLAVDKISGWFRDISDEVGLSRDRRTFLNLQIEIGQAAGMDELWERICQALEMMQFDRGELHTLEIGAASSPAVETAGAARSEAGFEVSSTIPPPEGQDRRRRSAKGPGPKTTWTHKEQKAGQSALIWARGYHRRREDALSVGLLRVEIPINDKRPAAARLILIKNLAQEAIQPYTMRRVEHLRRSVMDAMGRLHPDISARAAAPARGRRWKRVKAKATSMSNLGGKP